MQSTALRTGAALSLTVGVGYALCTLVFWLDAASRRRRGLICNEHRYAE